MEQFQNNSQAYVFHVAGLTTPPLAFQVLHAKGQVFYPGPEPEHYGPMGDCYHNAWHYALEHDLHYVEGYAIAGQIAIPIEHAWCVDDQGRVHDNTWRDGHSYFGMAFKSESLDELQGQIGYHCVLGNLWLLRGKPIPAIRQQLLDAALPINVVIPR